MSEFGRSLIKDAAEMRSRVADQVCPVKIRTGEHNNIEARNWFRTYNVCASCGYVERAK